jgi:hypothetical protein
VLQRRVDLDLAHHLHCNRLSNLGFRLNQDHQVQGMHVLAQFEARPPAKP